MNSPGQSPGSKETGLEPLRGSTPQPYRQMSYRQIFYQVVFGTKHRLPTIPEASERELYRYIYGIIQNLGCKLYRINGMPDHIHICSDLHPGISLNNYIKQIKVASSMWMKAHGGFPEFTNWQDDYGAFTYNVKEKDTVIEYVKNQKEHHRKESFYDEYKRLLTEHGILFNKKYLLQ